jgi:hypothetical protein
VFKVSTIDPAREDREILLFSPLLPCDCRSRPTPSHIPLPLLIDAVTHATSSIVALVSWQLTGLFQGLILNITHGICNMYGEDLAGGDDFTLITAVLYVSSSD